MIRRKTAAFTLIELLLVIAIIALLASMVSPVLRTVMDKARQTTCLSNLRQLGVAVINYTSEHDGYLPRIETDPTNPVYEPDVNAKPIFETLEKYGVTRDLLRCPGDMQAKLCRDKGQGDRSFFDAKKSSYEWRPTFDGELVSAAKIYTPGGTHVVPQSRVRLCCDYANTGEAPHLRSPESDSYNNLYADGHVSTLVIPKEQAAQTR